jgi:hypothetical protein
VASFTGRGLNPQDLLREVSAHHVLLTQAFPGARNLNSKTH